MHLQNVRPELRVETEETSPAKEIQELEPRKQFHRTPDARKRGGNIERRNSTTREEDSKLTRNDGVDYVNGWVKVRSCNEGKGGSLGAYVRHEYFGRFQCEGR